MLVMESQKDEHFFFSSMSSDCFTMGAATSIEAASALMSTSPSLESSEAPVLQKSAELECPFPHHKPPVPSPPQSQKSNPHLVREAVKFSGAYAPSQAPAGQNAPSECPVDHGNAPKNDQWVSECPAAIGQAMAEGKELADLDPTNMVCICRIAG